MYIYPRKQDTPWMAARQQVRDKNEPHTHTHTPGTKVLGIHETQQSKQMEHR
jgi:hypothetical protein